LFDVAATLSPESTAPFSVLFPFWDQIPLILPLINCLTGQTKAADGLTRLLRPTSNVMAMTVNILTMLWNHGSEWLFSNSQLLFVCMRNLHMYFGASLARSRQV
jgi:hypothetical protein